MTALLLDSTQWEGRRWFPFFPLLIVALWVLVLTVGGRWRHPYRQSGASVLADRYARGEIDEAEYLDRRAVLRRKP